MFNQFETSAISTEAEAMLFVGFRYIAPKTSFGVGFYRVTDVETKQVIDVLSDDWDAFVVEQGFASRDAIMGGCAIPAETFSELAEINNERWQPAGALA